MFVSELVLMRLELHKEDLFALLLHCWQLHFLMEVATVELLSSYVQRCLNSCINMNTGFFGIQEGQQISWLPTLDTLVTASGSPGFTF
jgi:hypothetical protein